MNFIKISFTKKKYIVNVSKFWGVLFLLFCLFIADLIWLYHLVFVSKTWHTLTFIGSVIALPFLILTTWIFVLILKWAERKLDRRMDEYVNNFEIAGKGDKGEVAVNEELNKLLDIKTCSILRNKHLPGRKSDVDFIIVGPQGIFILEVKNHFTPIYFDYKFAYFKSAVGKLTKIKNDIRSFVKWQSEKMEEYLTEEGLGNFNIHKAIAYLNPEFVHILDNGENKYKVYIANGLNGLDKFINETFLDNKFTPEECLAIVTILNKL